MSPWILRALAATVLVAGVVTVADALVVTDAERLDDFVDAVTQGDAGGRVEAALDHTDLARVPVEVVEGGRAEHYAEGESIELARRVQDALATLDEPDARLVQESVEMRDDTARVALRMRVGQELLDAQFGLVRRADGWIVSRVRVL